MFLSFIEVNINLTASLALLIVMMGKMGPKISCFMMGSSGFTSVKMVSPMYRSCLSKSPPMNI